MRRAFEVSPMGMAVLDLEGRFQAYNAAFSAITGYGADELIGRDARSIRDPSEYERDAAGWAALRAGAAKLYEAETRYLHADGHWVWVQVASTLVRDRGGAPAFFVNSTRDVTRERAKADALRRSEALYRAVAHHFPSGVVILFDRDLRILLVDGAGAGVLPHPVGWYEGRPLAESMSAETFAQLEPHSRAALAGREARFSVERHGRVFDSHALPVRDEAGAIFGGMVVSQDVTEQMRDERSRLSAIVASSDDAIVSCTPAGLIDTWNPGAERLYGRPEAEAIGRPVDELAAPGREGELREIVRRGLAGERTSGHETVHLGRGGARLDIALTASPIVGGRGVALIARDIGASKEAERKLKASLREKDVLLREVHHRVKNKLQLIASILNLQARRSADPAVRAALNENRERIYALGALHDALDGGRNLVDLDLSAYLSDVAKNTMRSALGRGAPRLELELTPLLVSVETAVPCGLITHELIVNAFKHAFPEGRTGFVRVGLRPAGPDAIELEVSDDGVGLPEGVEPHASPSVGLRLVTSLADQLRATVRVGREGGTSFRLRVPTARPA
ncbi:MAG TPA: PAS domain S-box protein [Polyangiaceae bacterium]|nr:PAS domain S-box protein [Polyangiaceae bacterium]